MKYVRPDSLQSATSLLCDESGISRILAGGTDVLVQLRSEIVEPDLIIDIKQLDRMRDIIAEDGGFRVGAAVSGAEIGEHDELGTLWPGVVEAVKLIGSTQVQGRATMVGNLCNGSPAADCVPGLVVAKAVVRIYGPDGFRDCPVQDIPVGPGQTSLAKGEIVTSIFLPARPKYASDAYLRFIPRTEMDIAVSSAGVSIELDGSGTCTAARVAVGAVAPTVLLVEDAGFAIVGSRLDEASIHAMVAAVEAACSPIDDKRGTVEFRIKTAGVLAKRAARIAYARAGDKK